MSLWRAAVLRAITATAISMEISMSPAATRSIVVHTTTALIMLAISTKITTLSLITSITKQQKHSPLTVNAFVFKLLASFLIFSNIASLSLGTFQNINYICSWYWYHLAIQAWVIKRESGGNPEQTRCCNLLAKSSNLHNPLFTWAEWEGCLKMEKVRRPATIYRCKMLSGTRATTYKPIYLAQS